MSQQTSDIQLLTNTFHDLTGKFMVIQEQNIDLARAMDDKDTLIKEQIKLEVMKTAVGIFQHSLAQARHKKVSK